LGWNPEYFVQTDIPRGGKAASCIWYLIDIAFPIQKIAIEIDGGSHLCTAVKERDAKKDLRLADLGWTVLRLSNKQVLEDTGTCLSIISKLLITITTLPAAS
jgi:very-short-patch-repair endonuclease